MMAIVCALAGMVEYLIAAVLALLAIVGILTGFETSDERKVQRKYLKEVKRNVRT